MKIGKFKKIAAIGLALTMAIGLLYTSGTVNAVDSKTDNGIVLNKTAEYDSLTDQVKITLESYATGKVVSGERTPSDIVLLLDVSGSMDKPFGNPTKQYIEKEFERYMTIELLQYDRTDYYYQVDGQYYKVYIESYWSDRNRIYQLYYTNGNNKVYILDNWVNEDTRINSLNITLYEYKEVQSKKIDALKNAANTFIDGIAEQNANITDSNLKDRISIVKFAGDNNYNEGDEFYGWYNYNYTQIVKNLTNISDSQDLKNVVNNLTAAGATSADYGLERAQTALGSKQEGRNQVVIMFTDGEPNHDSGFDSTVAKDAIDFASNMKGTGVTIYTVGVFEKADPSNTESNFNKYMHAVSSNYLDITYENEYRQNFYNMDLGDRNPDGKDYYLTAKNPDDLINAFKQILDDVGESSSDLTDDAVVIDYIEDSFNLPANAEQIEVSTVDYKNGDFDISTKKPLSNAVVDIDEEYKAVEVTGFNYSDFYVLKDNPDDDHVGKKLVIEFYITPIDGFIGGNNIETNKDLSGIYQDSYSREPIEEFTNPNVDIPLEYEIENYDATIYRGNNWQDFVHFITNDNNKIVYKNKRHNKEESTTFELNGVRNEYVNITYTIKDSNDEVVAELSIPAGNTIEDLKILNNFTAKNLKDCTDFEVSVKVEPKDDKNDGVESIDATSQLISTLHVLKPNIHVNDSTIDFGTQTNLKEKNVSYNLSDEWVDVKNHSNIPDVEGTKPELSLSIEKVDSSTQKLENEIYIPMEAKDADFRLVVTKNGDSNISYNDCVINGNKQTNMFIVHIRTATLDIEKCLDPNSNDYDLKDGKPIFIYKVTVDNQHLGENIYYRYICLDENMSTNNDLSVLDKLPVGQYKIEELDTLRFEFEKAEVTKGSVINKEYNENSISFKICSLENNTEFEVEFTNSAKSKDYDSDNDIIVNTFEKGPNGEVIMNQRLNDNN